MIIFAVMLNLNNTFFSFGDDLYKTIWGFTDKLVCLPLAEFE